jgi:hypothetical protein
MMDLRKETISCSTANFVEGASYDLLESSVI